MEVRLSRTPRRSESSRDPRGCGDLLGLRREVLAGINEAVALEAVLLVVQLPITPTRRQQLLVRPPLHDFSVLEDQDLIRALNRRQPVRDDERRASAPERSQTVLNERFTLAVEAG